MHPLNPYLHNKPNFAQLANRYTDFAQYVNIGPDGYASVDFQDSGALKALTKCLLKEDWGLDIDLRDDRLVPTIANRLDYLLHVLDLEPYLDPSHSSRITASSARRTDQEGSADISAAVAKAKNDFSLIRILDIGTGAVAIYPLLLHVLRPKAQIIATEINPVSLEHANSVLLTNGIPKLSISLRQPSANDNILFALVDDAAKFDIAICNPPFFGSAGEMREGQELKANLAHSAPTAAENELITPGGEVAFVGRMIEESRLTREKCLWYTSLIGKYSSLQPLTELLYRHQIDNYFIKSIKPARTVRWILGWSYTAVRLPDSVTRPEPIISHTSYAKLLPPPNHLIHTPLHPPLTVDQLRESVIGVLRDIHLAPIPKATDETVPSRDEGDSILLAPMSNTWSRSARRQATRATVSTETAQSKQPEVDMNANDMSDEPLMRVRLSFVPPTPPSADGQGGKGDWRGSSLTLDWLEGRDRGAVDAFWKFLLTKAGLLGRVEPSQGGGRGGRSGRGRRGG